MGAWIIQDLRVTSLLRSKLSLALLLLFGIQFFNLLPLRFRPKFRGSLLL
jgi:hypothetical protein